MLLLHVSQYLLWLSGRSHILQHTCNRLTMVWEGRDAGREGKGYNRECAADFGV